MFRQKRKTKEPKPGGKRCERLPRRGRSTAKRQVNHSYGTVLGVFVYFWPVAWFLFPGLACSRTLPFMRVQVFQMDPSPEACGKASTSPPWVCPLLLIPKDPFYAWALSLLPQGWEKYGLLIFYSEFSHSLFLPSRLPLSVLRN